MAVLESRVTAVVQHICRVFAFSENPAADTGTYVVTTINPDVTAYYARLRTLLVSIDIKEIPSNVADVISSCFMHHLALNASTDAAAWKECLKHVTHTLYFPDMDKLEYMYGTPAARTLLQDIKHKQTLVKQHATDFTPLSTVSLDANVIRAALLNPGLVTCNYFKVLHHPERSERSPSTSKNTLWHYLCDRKQAIRGKAQKKLFELLEDATKTDAPNAVSLMARVMLALIFHTGDHTSKT